MDKGAEYKNSQEVWSWSMYHNLNGKIQKSICPLKVLIHILAGTTCKIWFEIPNRYSITYIFRWNMENTFHRTNKISHYVLYVEDWWKKDPFHKLTAVTHWHSEFKSHSNKSVDSCGYYAITLAPPFLHWLHEDISSC